MGFSFFFFFKGLIPQIRPALGLYSVHFGPILDRKCSFSYTSYGKYIDDIKLIFAPWYLRLLGEQNLAGRIVLHGDMTKVRAVVLLCVFIFRAPVKVNDAEKSLKFVKLLLEKKESKKRPPLSIFALP